MKFMYASHSPYSKDGSSGFRSDHILSGIPLTNGLLSTIKHNNICVGDTGNHVVASLMHLI